MAFLPQEEQDALVSRLSLDGAGPRAITHPDRLGEELARTKERGYAVDDEELGGGRVRCGRVRARWPGMSGGIVRHRYPRFPELPNRPGELRPAPARRCGGDSGAAPVSE